MTSFSIAYKLKLSIQQFANNMKRVNRLAKKNKLIMRSLTKDIQKYKGSFIKFALGGVAAFTGITIAASKFESGLSNVLTLLDKRQIKIFGKDLELAAEDAIKMGFTMDDVNKGLFDNISALGASESSIKTFRTAQKLAIGGNAELSASVLGLAKIINVYGRETTDSTRVANALFSAQKVGTTTVQELALNVGKVAGQAKITGLSYEEMLSTLAVLTNVMRNTEEASTAMAAVMKAVTKPGKQQMKLLNKLGITYGVSRIRTVGFSQVLKEVSEAMKKNADAVAFAIPEIRAFRGIANLSEESLKLMDDTVKMINKDIENGTGLNEAYARKLKDTAIQAKIASGHFKIMSRRFGKELLPATVLFFKTATKLMLFFINLPAPIKRLILVIGGLATAFSMLLVGIAGFLAIKSTLIGALAIITKGFIITWAAALGPTGAIIIAIGIIIGLGILLYKKWEPFRIVIDYLWEQLKRVAKFVWKISPLVMLGKLIYKNWEPIKDLFSSIWEFIKKISGALGIIKETFSKVQKFITGEKAVIAGTKYEEDINRLLMGKGEFAVNIGLTAPRGTVKSVETKEKADKGNMRMNLGFNMQEA